MTKHVLQGLQCIYNNLAMLEEVRRSFIASKLQSLDVKNTALQVLSPTFLFYLSRSTIVLIRKSNDACKGVMLLKYLELSLLMH